MRCGTHAVPAGSLVRGRVVDSNSVGGALRQLLARCEITETRALVAVSDALATFRILELPPEMVDGDVAALVAREMPLDPERINVSWQDLATAGNQRIVYAVAWDRALVRNVIDAVRSAGLEPIVVDVKSAALARALSEPSCVLVDLSADPVDIVLIDGHMPRVWQAVPAKGSLGPDVVSSLVPPVRSMLRFYRRRATSEFTSRHPVLICGEHVLPRETLISLGEAVAQPVLPVPAPPRVDPRVRHATFLTCLGLMMRRTA